MLFDLDYDDVPITPPVQHTPGTQQHTDEVSRFVDEFGALAIRSGYNWQEVAQPQRFPFVPRPGCKYLAVVRYPDPTVMHCLAIDEHGTAFDPDSAEPSAVDLGLYEVILFVQLDRKCPQGGDAKNGT
jgi:hypothetical protein